MHLYPVPDLRYPFLGVHFTVRPDGEVRNIIGRGRAVRDPGGRIVSLLGVCVDVTAARIVQ